MKVYQYKVEAINSLLAFLEEIPVPMKHTKQIFNVLLNEKTEVDVEEPKQKEKGAEK